MLLEANDIEVRFGRVHALKGVSIKLQKGEIVAVLGANGAGKTSLLRGLLGLERVSGRILFDGSQIADTPPHARIRGGLVLVPEGRRIVIGLTVHENLLMGAFNRRDTEAVRGQIDDLYARFPNLAARRDHPASVLSGGEQQMLAICRALLAAPKLMMLDEPSLGLSPRLCNEVFQLIGQLNHEQGLTILLVEQNTNQALRRASRAYVLELGRVVLEGSPDELLANSALRDAYLGRNGRQDANAARSTQV